MKLHLIIQMYRPGNRRVLDRLLGCIDANLALNVTEAITILCDRIRLNTHSPKLRLVEIRERASFGEMLRIAADVSPHEASHVAIANADIQFTTDVEAVLDRITDPSTVAAISRHEANGTLCRNPAWSQDAWLIKTHRLPGILIDCCGYKPGIAGCENRFAMDLFSHGYKLWNPCLDCRIIHTDPDPREDYAIRYFGAYLYVPPCTIADVGLGPPRFELALNKGSLSFDAARETRVPAARAKKPVNSSRGSETEPGP